MLPVLLALTSIVLTAVATPFDAAPRPLVLWHGLGDSHSSAGMLEFASLIKDVHPGIFIHSVFIEENLDADQRAGFFGHLNDQIQFVSEQLAAIDELQGGFDAIGFSQGGQFLRAYVERYNSPPVHNLITFGSQHMGIADLPLCRPGDVLCQLARNAARSGVYSSWAQTNLIQAQYFRDPARLPSYLASNHFLTSINNEVPASFNTTYAANLAALDNLVLVLFSADKTVVPKESSWFGSYAPPTDDDDEDDLIRSVSEGEDCHDHRRARAQRDETILPMRMQPLYTEDWIGLRTLDQAGRVILETCEGAHMHLTDECWKPIVKRFVGSTPSRPSTLRVQA